MILTGSRAGMCTWRRTARPHSEPFRPRRFVLFRGCSSLSSAESRAVVDGVGEHRRNLAGTELKNAAVPRNVTFGPSPKGPASPKKGMTGPR